MKKVFLTLFIIASSSAFANPVQETPKQVSTETNTIDVTNPIEIPVLTPIVKNSENTNPSPTKPVEVKESNSFNEVQGYSKQSTEEYIKRRNSTFNSSLSSCINEIPRNTRGQRDPEEMLKCANKN